MHTPEPQPDKQNTKFIHDTLMNQSYLNIINDCEINLDTSNQHYNSDRLKVKTLLLKAQPA